MPKRASSTEGLDTPAASEKAVEGHEVIQATGSQESHQTPLALAPAPPAPVPAEQSGDASFPSPHIIYLGVVRNELESQLMRFRNGLEMLTAKANGAQTAYEDEMKALAAEYERKKQERQDSHLGEITRLKVQIGDITDVIETYEEAIAKADAITERQAQADAAAEGALK